MSVTDRDLPRLATEVVAIAQRAGRVILDIYDAGFDVYTKTDGSPLTTADRNAHELIVAALTKLDPRLPVLSEESAEVAHSVRAGWEAFWLVDPLDGTKEFVKRNGEFTVNIALIVGDKPVLGVVHTPVRDLTHWGHRGGGARRVEGDSPAQTIAAREYRGGHATVVASRSHGRAKVETFLHRLRDAEGPYDVLSMGSALKICLVAEGRADVYPRLGPTYEWDTAAAHCVLDEAGGALTDCAGAPLRYNKPSLVNPWFVARGRGGYDWYRLLSGLEDPG